MCIAVLGFCFCLFIFRSHFLLFGRNFLFCFSYAFLRFVLISLSFIYGFFLRIFIGELVNHTMSLYVLEVAKKLLIQNAKTCVTTVSCEHPAYIIGRWGSSTPRFKAHSPSKKKEEREERRKKKEERRKKNKAPP